jgi:hypothetical protein
MTSPDYCPRVSTGANNHFTLRVQDYRCPVNQEYQIGEQYVSNKLNARHVFTFRTRGRLSANCSRRWRRCWSWRWRSGRRRRWRSGWSWSRSRRWCRCRPRSRCRRWSRRWCRSWFWFRCRSRRRLAAYLDLESHNVKRFVHIGDITLPAKCVTIPCECPSVAGNIGRL